MLVPTVPSAQKSCRHSGDPLISFPVLPHFRSLMLLIQDSEWVDTVLPEFVTLRAGLANAEMLLLAAVREVCPLVEAGGELDGDARIARLTASHHEQGDSVSGFVTGFA